MAFGVSMTMNTIYSRMIFVQGEKGKTMFCEDFDKFNKVYIMKGGRRGNGAICFLTSRNAKLRAQLEVANAKIAELEKKLIKQQIRGFIGSSEDFKVKEMCYPQMYDEIKKKVWF